MLNFSQSLSNLFQTNTDKVPEKVIDDNQCELIEQVKQDKVEEDKIKTESEGVILFIYAFPEINHSSFISLRSFSEMKIKETKKCDEQFLSVLKQYVPLTSSYHLKNKFVPNIKFDITNKHDKNCEDARKLQPNIKISDHDILKEYKNDCLESFATNIKLDYVISLLGTYTS